MRPSGNRTVRVERTAPVATVWLDRPRHHNVLDRDGWHAFAEAFEELSADNSLRAVTVRGAGGRAFSAGSDIGAFGAQRETREGVRLYSRAIASAMEAVSGCRHPTVAIIEGICVGGGLEIAACCDLRVCGESSRFGAPIHRLGLTMSYDELRPLLTLLGSGPLLEILLTGELIDSERALAAGLVHRVWPDGSVVEEGSALVDRIVAGAPSSTGGTRSSSAVSSRVGQSLPKSGRRCTRRSRRGTTGRAEAPSSKSVRPAFGGNERMGPAR